MTEEELDFLARQWHSDAHAPESLKRQPVSERPSPIRWMPAVILGISMAGAVSIIALVTRPMPAFADIEKNLKSVQTVQWEEEQEMFDERGRQESRTISELSLRRSPAAMLIIEKESYWKGMKRFQEADGVFQNLITPERSYAFNPKVNQIVITKYGKTSQARAIASINSEINYSVISSNKKMGRSTSAWRRTLINDELVFERNGGEESYGFKLHEKFWVHPRTLQVLRSEVIRDTLKSPHYRLVRRCRNIRYNPALPDSYFRIARNAATKVVERKKE